ncbi:MAG: MEKHLA domain-containing protein [Mariprofundaceae bacterium]|nr:MEKHLA domain-containing protein [Mariprofundaceae bacterium]
MHAPPHLSVDHVTLLRRSLKHWTGRDLVPPDLDDNRAAGVVFDALFAIVSHGTEPDPVFNYANRTALTLFEMDWDVFTAMPSRLSADPVSREERARLLAEVSRMVLSTIMPAFAFPEPADGS